MKPSLGPCALLVNDSELFFSLFKAVTSIDTRCGHQIQIAFAVEHTDLHLATDPGKC